MEEQMSTTISEQDNNDVNALIDHLTLSDDDLMSRVFNKNTEATELILRIILGREIKVVSVEGQEEFKNPEVGGRNITLDVHAIDVNGEEIDIEVQGNSEGAHIRRARYHSSMVDSRILKEGQAFKELKDSYVIFIYKHDKFRKGLTLYHIDRYVRETNELFEDGSHIIYVNGNYKGDDEIGKLMEDFHQQDPDNMYYDASAQGVKHFKETEKGRDQMCEAVENYAKEYAKRHAEEYAKEYAKRHAEEYAKEYEIKGKIAIVQNVMESMGMSLEQALDISKIQGEERELIVEELQN